MIPEAPASTLDEAFRAFACAWFTALAEHREEEACRMLDEPNSYGVAWTPQALHEAVTQSGYRDFTAPEAAQGTLYNCDGGAFDDGSGYWFDHDAPLDGTWSDLTAQFEFLKRASGLAVVLHDLHVL